ncbi:MAG: hypothetical protein BWY11_02205 [Firmicutes bacterium ADurb.Bin182]|nr:MAG: hypothetical protein BWY11_02205 [Firmicutes bacterium ADurb.Bin182]
MCMRVAAIQNKCTKFHKKCQSEKYNNLKCMPVSAFLLTVSGAAQAVSDFSAYKRANGEFDRVQRNEYQKDIYGI